MKRVEGMKVAARRLSRRAESIANQNKGLNHEIRENGKGHKGSRAGRNVKRDQGDFEMSRNDFSENLFWDADPADLDFSKHMKYVVQRVLERGTLDDIRHMFSMYGFDNVVATSKTLRSLDPVSFSFIVNLSGQPKESFRCYTLKQSSQAPWIY